MSDAMIFCAICTSEPGNIAKVCFAHCSTSNLTLGSPGCLGGWSSPCPKYNTNHSRSLFDPTHHTVGPSIAKYRQYSVMSIPSVPSVPSLISTISASIVRTTVSTVSPNTSTLSTSVTIVSSSVSTLSTSM